MAMRTEELKERIRNGNEDAFDLLLDAVPNAAKRFDRLTKDLAKLREEVRKHFPDAIYYTAGGDGFVLILGDTHSGKGEKSNEELVALSSEKLTVMGGGW